MFNKSNGYNTAVVTDSDENITYNDLTDFSKKIQNKLEPGSLVLCLLKNSIGSFIGYTSFLQLKFVQLILSSEINEKFLRYYIKTFKPKYLWIPNNKIRLFKKNSVILSIFDFSLILIKSHSFFSMHRDLALLLPTSGSTGSPKIVKLTTKNLESNAKSIVEYLSIKVDEKPITVLPMHYSYGLSIINSHIIRGAKILLTEKSLVEKSFWNFLIKYKATSLSGIPYTFELLDKLGFYKMNLPFLKTLTQAGGKLDKDLSLKFAKFCKKSNKKFIVMYGQTEASPRMSYLPNEYSIIKNGSIGVPIPGGNFFLINRDGEKIDEIEKTGELVYTGANVSMGYAYKIEDLKNHDQNRGILHTGDLAKKDDDNFYFIVGRKKRFIKLFGNRINLDEVELLTKNKFGENAIIGSDNTLMIFLTKEKSKVEVIKYISKMLGINKVAIKIQFINKIPKNLSEKIDYNSLKILWE